MITNLFFYSYIFYNLESYYTNKFIMKPVWFKSTKTMKIIYKHGGYIRPLKNKIIYL
jgi:hypothetical protein